MAAAAQISCQELFLRELEKASRAVLVFDYDHTAGLFHSSPRDGPSIGDLLRAVMSGGKTRLIVLSDMRAMEVASLLQISPAPEIWGSRGLEKRAPDGDCEIIDICDEPKYAIASLDLALEGEGLREFTEIRPGSVTVRWNGTGPQVAAEVRARVLSACSAVNSLFLAPREFEGGIEFYFRFWNKSHAVRSLLGETPDEVPLAYIGDDFGGKDARSPVRDCGLHLILRSKLLGVTDELCVQALDEVAGFLAGWLHACTSHA